VNARSHPVEQAANPAAASPRTAAARLRSSTKRLVRGVPDLLLRLPAPSTDYAVRPVRIPMRDGVELAADLYAPTNPTGALRIRGLYGCGTSRLMLPVLTSEEPP